MEIIGIAILFFMASITAGQSSNLETPKLSELWLNYLLALLSIVFGIGFAMLTSKIATGDITNMRLLILLAILPGFFGVVLNNWVVSKIASISKSSTVQSRKAILLKWRGNPTAKPDKENRTKRSSTHENEASAA